MNRIALAIVAVMFAAGTAAADVTCDFYEISATSGKTASMDSALPPILAKRLGGGPFKQWNTFKVMSTITKSLAKKKPEKLALKQGSASMELLAIVDRSKTQVRAIVEDGGKVMADQQLTIEAGDWQVVVVDKPSGGHLVAAGCK